MTPARLLGFLAAVCLVVGGGRAARAQSDSASDWQAKQKYDQAKQLYDRQQLEQAVPVLQQIVERYIGSQSAIPAADLLLDALGRLGRWKEQAGLIDSFLANGCALGGGSEFRTRLVRHKADALAAEGEAHERQGNYVECGISFVAAAETFPDHDDHARRLYRAARCFEQADLIGQAIKAAEQLIRDHPANPLARDALFRIAAGYERLCFFSEAAKRYEQLAAKFPDHVEAAAGLRAAFGFRTALGEFDKAAVDLNDFLERYAGRQPSLAADLVFAKGEWLEPRKTDLVLHLQNYLKEWAGKGNLDNTLLAHFKLGEIAWAESCPRPLVEGMCVERLGEGAAEAQRQFSTVLRLWAFGEAEGRLRDRLRTPDLAARVARLRSAVAGAAFRRAEALHERFLQAAAEPDPAQATDLLKQLVGKDGLYPFVIDIDASPWQLAALARMGLAQAQLANRMAPASAIDARAKAAGAAAEAAYEKCLAVARATSTAGPWVELCQAGLHARRGQAFPLLAEIVPTPGRNLGAMVFPGMPADFHEIVSDAEREALEEAAAGFRRASKVGGLDVRACVSLVRAFRDVAKRFPHLLAAQDLEAVVALHCGRKDDAISIWNRLANARKPYAASVASLGYLTGQGGNLPAAQSLFERAIVADPLTGSIAARVNLALQFLGKAKVSGPDVRRQLYDLAVRHLRTVLALDTSNAYALAGLVLAYQVIGLPELSRLAATQALQRSNGDAGRALASVHTTLAQIAASSGEQQQATAEYAQAARLAPGVAEVGFNRAAQLLAATDYRGAEAAFRGVLATDPRDYEARIGLGVALRAQGSLDGAEAEYERARQSAPARPEAYFNLGVLYGDFRVGVSSAALGKAADYYRGYLARAFASSSWRKEAERRLAEIEAAKRQTSE